MPRRKKLEHRVSAFGRRRLQPASEIVFTCPAELDKQQIPGLRTLPPPPVYHFSMMFQTRKSTMKRFHYIPPGLLLAIAVLLTAPVWAYQPADETAACPDNFPLAPIRGPQLAALDVGLSQTYVEQLLGAPRVARVIPVRCETVTHALRYARWSDVNHEVQALFASDQDLYFIAVYFVIRILRAHESIEYSYNHSSWRLPGTPFYDLGDHYGAFETGNARHRSYTERHYFGRPGNYHWFYFAMQASSFLPGRVPVSKLVSLAQEAKTGEPDSGFSLLRADASPNAVGIGDREAFPETCTVTSAEQSWDVFLQRMVGTFAGDFENTLVRRPWLENRSGSKEGRDE